MQHMQDAIKITWEMGSHWMHGSVYLLSVFESFSQEQVHLV